MKIEIEKPSKKFYKEFLSIVYSYNNIRKNPNLKIKDKFKEYGAYLVISIIFEILSIRLLCFDKSTFNIILLVCWSLCLLLSIYIFTRINLNLKEQLKNSNKSKFIMDEDGVELKKNKDSFKLSWDNMNNIIIGKETITFIPKEVGLLIICIPVLYKDELLKGINKFKYNELVIDNTK